MDHPREVEVREFLQYLETLDGGEELQTIKAMCESYAYLLELVREENMTIDRLHEIVFGSAGQADGVRGPRGEERPDAAGRRALRRRRRRRRLVPSKARRAAH
jgi:hypothetical protein